MIDKKLKAVVQGGVDNYLGKQPQVQAPRKWQSCPDKPATELAYITEAEKDLILKANIHGGLEGGPNMGPSGIMSLDSFGDVGGGGASGGDTSAGGGANEGASFSGRSVAEMNSPRDKAFENRVANERAALQIAERAQANNLGYNERANIANATYGPLQKYTGERGFLGNLFRGANKYGYTDTYTSGPKAGQVKPGFGGRIMGGLLSLATGIPFVGGAIGTAYDYGKGIFGRKPRDMSQFNKLGLYDDRMKQKTFYDKALLSDNYSDQKISNTSFSQKPNLNNLESLLQGINFTNADAIRAMTQPGFTEQATVYDPYGIGVEDGRFSYDMNKTSVDDFNNGSTDGIMGIDVEYPGNELFANASAPGNNFSYNTGNPYKDNLYNEDGEYDPYSIKGEPEVKEIATG